MEQKSTDLRSLLASLREITDITELNQTMMNKLIQRIEVHSNEKKHSHNRVKRWTSTLPPSAWCVSPMKKKFSTSWRIFRNGIRAPLKL